MNFNGFEITPQSGEAGANNISISVPAVNESIDKVVEIDAINGDKSARLTLIHEGMREPFRCKDGDFILADGGTFNVLKPRDTSGWLHIEALEDGFTFRFSNALEYSLDEAKTWSALAANTDSAPLNNGERVWLRANLAPASSAGIGTFTLAKQCNVGGNAASLLVGGDAKDVESIPQYGLQYLFQNCVNLMAVDDDIVPIPTLQNYACRFMFKGCTNLKKAPALPSISIGRGAYLQMFYGCTALEEAGVIYATTLGIEAMKAMFYGCTKLAKVQDELPATTLNSNCYNGMYYQCSLLEKAPALPALTLVSSCYSSMFQYCSKLNYVKAMFTTSPSASYTSNWLSGVASSGTFVKNTNAKWTTTGASAVPSGWTIIKEG